MKECVVRHNIFTQANASSRVNRNSVYSKSAKSRNPKDSGYAGRTFCGSLGGDGYEAGVNRGGDIGSREFRYNVA